MAYQALLLSLLTSVLGCRTLRARRQTQALSDARQNSLRGAEKLQQNKLKDAEFLFTEALRQSVVDERAQWGMAEVLWQQDERVKAIEHMTRAVAISGDSPELLVRLGEMNLEEGQLERALEQADQALEAHRRSAGAWALRGQVMQRREKFEEALICYHRALGIQPHLPNVQLALADVYHSVGRPQRVLATLETMTDNQSPEQISPRAWLLKGQSLAALGEQGAARTHLRKAALCASDDDMQLLLAVAESQVEAGDFSEARLCLGRVFRYDPYNSAALQIQHSIDDGPGHNVTRGSLVGFEQPPVKSHP